MIGTVWKHLKTGHAYTIMGVCRLEATNRPAILYRRADGSSQIVWARDEEEFLDGRFERVEVG